MSARHPLRGADPSGKRRVPSSESTGLISQLCPRCSRPCAARREEKLTSPVRFSSRNQLSGSRLGLEGHRCQPVPALGSLPTELLGPPRRRGREAASKERLGLPKAWSLPLVSNSPGPELCETFLARKAGRTQCPGLHAGGAQREHPELDSCGGELGTPKLRPWLVSRGSVPSGQVLSLPVTSATHIGLHAEGAGVRSFPPSLGPSPSAAGPRAPGKLLLTAVNSGPLT